jgi:hypothetical protein
VLTICHRSGAHSYSSAQPSQLTRLAYILQHAAESWTQCCILALSAIINIATERCWTSNCSAQVNTSFTVSKHNHILRLRLLRYLAVLQRRVATLTSCGSRKSGGTQMLLWLTRLCPWMLTGGPVSIKTPINILWEPQQALPGMPCRTEVLAATAAGVTAASS